LLQLLLLLGLFGVERRHDVGAPLPVEISGIFLVDLLLLVRRRIGTCDIEAAVLHEVVIGIAAARLAASGELGVAIGELRGPVFLGVRLLGAIGAVFKILRRAAPPLRLCWRRREQEAGNRGGNSQRR